MPCQGKSHSFRLKTNQSAADRTLAASRYLKADKGCKWTPYLTRVYRNMIQTMDPCIVQAVRKYGDQCGSYLQDNALEATVVRAFDPGPLFTHAALHDDRLDVSTGRPLGRIAAQCRPRCLPLRREMLSSHGQCCSLPLADLKT